MRFLTPACLFLLFATTAVYGQGGPTVTGLNKSAGGVGDAVTISGSGFRATQGSSTVTFNKKTAQEIKTWTDSSIIAVVPPDATSGDVVVTIDGKSSAAGTKFTLPTIEQLSPPLGTSGAVGDLVTIKGHDFGNAPGKVTFNDKKPAKSQSTVWSDTSIVVTVPSGAVTGNVVVTTADGHNSAPMPLDVKPPEYDPTHFEVITGVGAVLAGAEATSYKTNNDALSAANVGRKTPEILLGGSFIMPCRWGGRWIEKSYCGVSQDCQPGGAYYHYRPWATFLSIRFAPTTDQTINGFVLGGGYRITKYFSLVIGYSVTPVDEPSPGFRVAAAQVVSANPTISPYSRYNPSDLLLNKPGAFDGFPLFVYNASGVTTTKLFPNNPTVTHHRSGIYFGVGIPLNLTALFKPSGGKQ